MRLFKKLKCYNLSRNHFKPITAANLPVIRSPRKEKNKSVLHRVHISLKYIFFFKTPASQSWSELIAQKSK